MTRHSSDPPLHTYFAYGIFMDRVRMKQCCPDSWYSGYGFIENYRLTFGSHSEKWGGGEAMLQQAKGSRVLGVIYTVPDRDLPKLDEHEGHPHRYERGHARVHVHFGGRERMLCYHLVDNTLEAKPSPLYLGIIARAYERLGYTFPSASQVASIHPPRNEKVDRA